MLNFWDWYGWGPRPGPWSGPGASDLNLIHRVTHKYRVKKSQH